jgi:hypothetical protein
VVAHIVEQLGGQLRVDSKVDEGSRFSFLIPFATSEAPQSLSPSSSLLARSRTSASTSSAPGSSRSIRSELDSFVDALSSSHMDNTPAFSRGNNSKEKLAITPGPDKMREQRGYFDVAGSATPLRAVRMDGQDLDESVSRGFVRSSPTAEAAVPASEAQRRSSAGRPARKERAQAKTKLRILNVEVILAHTLPTPFTYRVSRPG